MTKVLVSDPIDQAGIDILTQVAQVDQKVGLSTDQLKNIISDYAGVRPLVFDSNTMDVSKINRDSAIELNESLINIFGGKWTSGPSLGEKVSDMIESSFR